MFNRKIKSLKQQIRDLQEEKEAVRTDNSSLRKQRDAFAKENSELRVQIADMRAEFDGTIDAKEIERQEIADQLAKASHEIEKLKAKIARKGFPRDNKGKFTAKQ